MSVLCQDPVRSLVVIRGVQDHLTPSWLIEKGRHEVSIILVISPLKHARPGGAGPPLHPLSEPAPGLPGALRLYWSLVVVVVVVVVVVIVVVAATPPSV